MMGKAIETDVFWPEPCYQTRGRTHGPFGTHPWAMVRSSAFEALEFLRDVDGKDRWSGLAWVIEEELRRIFATAHHQMALGQD